MLSALGIFWRKFYDEICEDDSAFRRYPVHYKKVDEVQRKQRDTANEEIIRRLKALGYME